mgnify:CR=1 FL=1|jgi:hypothetical protein
MLFFIVILISAMTLGFHVLHLDKKQNNILESCSEYETECAKSSNSTFISKSFLAKENDKGVTDEEKRLLHLSKLI